VPLGIYTWSRSNVVLSISVTQASLVLLGLSLARSFRGKSFIWMTGMFSFGLAVMIIGFYVRIVS
jgi:VIT1/CCC1 family predicted Fe2+/Mn2+ transporter